jgi:hypothetical protein
MCPCPTTPPRPTSTPRFDLDTLQADNLGETPFWLVQQAAV